MSTSHSDSVARSVSEQNEKKKTKSTGGDKLKVAIDNNAPDTGKLIKSDINKLGRMEEIPEALEGKEGMRSEDDKSRGSEHVSSYMD